MKSWLNLQQVSIRQIRILADTTSRVHTTFFPIGILLIGRWTSSVFPYPLQDRVVLGRKLTFADSSLVDACGVDIELPGRQGIILHSLSDDSNDGKAAARAFIADRLVKLAAQERYQCLHLILCSETDLSPSLAMQVTEIQNACAGEECPTFVTVQLSSLLGVSFAIAQTILHSLLHEKVASYQQMLGKVLETGVSERATFLVKLIPKISALDALKCAATKDQFQLLLRNRIARVKMATTVSPESMKMLSHVLGAVV